ncbi:hypothetical protein [Streptomyces sp. SYSU K21746]
MARVGSRNVAVLGALIAAAGFGWPSTMGPETAYLTGIAVPGVLLTAAAVMLLWLPRPSSERA